MSISSPLYCDRSIFAYYPSIWLLSASQRNFKISRETHLGACDGLEESNEDENQYVTPPSSPQLKVGARVLTYRDPVKLPKDSFPWGEAHVTEVHASGSARVREGHDPGGRTDGRTETVMNARYIQKLPSPVRVEEINEVAPQELRRSRRTKKPPDRYG